MIVAYAAGGTGDVVARIVAPKLSIVLGQVGDRGKSRRRQRRHRRAQRRHR